MMTKTHRKPDLADKLSPESTKALKELRTFITKEFGKRCKTRGHGCYCCQMWAAYDLFEILVNA